ncbi:unnamed protein product [Thelazia callipaeda]|uniref:EF-hand domain-containing protein n=1 Tax=Thelazia callipaeda TaxID=103827 RepID=A0A0N5D9B5_THECL|nr:unnamed protein product [Thelazia callipaeda]
MPRSLCGNLLYCLSSSRLLILRFKSGIPSLEELKKLESDYHPSTHTIFGSRRKDSMHYTNRKVGVGYWHFSNNIYPIRLKFHPKIAKWMKLNFFILFSVFLGLCIDFSWVGHQIKKITTNFRPEAADPNLKDNENFDQTVVHSVDTNNRKKKKRLSFREKRIIEYENRVRAYSAPDKIFRYFATLKIAKDGSSRTFDIYMTPKDFVRSLTPGIIQPHGLELDRFMYYDPHKNAQNFANPNSVFAKLNEYGLISFGDYLFLMTMFSISSCDFVLAFRIFGENNKEELNKTEFEKLQELALTYTNVGQRHRDNASVGLYANKDISPALSYFFFGADGKQKLSIKKFIDFQICLYKDVLEIELELKDEESLRSGVISYISFADLLLVYAGVSGAKKRKMLHRVKKKIKSEKRLDGIKVDEIESFFGFLYSIEDVDLALHFFNVAEVGITDEILKSVSKKIVGKELPENVIDVVITLFDEDEDGALSRDEFITVMKKRLKRGLEKPKDTGFIKLFDAVGKCCMNTVKDSLDIT